LAEDGEVILFAARERRRDVRAALLNLALEPTDLGFLHAYPQVVGASTRADAIRVDVEIPEAP
jgi:hypothetical protein